MHRNNGLAKVSMFNLHPMIHCTNRKRNNIFMSGYVWQAWKQQNNRTSLLDSTQFWPFRLPMYDIVCTVSCTVLSYKAGWKNMVFLYHASYKATFCMVHFTVFFSIVQNVLCKMYLFHIIRNGLRNGLITIILSGSWHSLNVFHVIEIT